VNQLIHLADFFGELLPFWRAYPTELQSPRVYSPQFNSTSPSLEAALGGEVSANVMAIARMASRNENRSGSPVEGVEDDLLGNP
jgi:hypothetical protein